MEAVVVTGTTGCLPGLFPLDDWQKRFDAAFPDAINFRIIPTEPPLDTIDSTTGCLTVVGMHGDHPLLCFFDAAVEGKDFRFPAEVVQVQVKPFPRFELRPLDGRACIYHVWPRPIRPEHAADWADLKRAHRESALWTEIR